MAIKKARLGRGLDVLIAGGIPQASGVGAQDALVGTTDPLPSPEGFREIDIALLEPSPHQPRREMEQTQIAELAESIRQEGLLQPVVVRQIGDKYQLVAGERRWRACQSLGMKTILARLVHVGESSAAAIALIETFSAKTSTRLMSPSATPA
jgi:ParB family chromosome partitioning protein